MMASAPNLLATIVAATRRSVVVREQELSLHGLQAQLTRRPRGDAFHVALSQSPAPRIIAECKRRSPSRGILREHYDPAAHASAYASAGAAAISVLTEPTFFDGAPDHLRAVAAAVDVPLLRKDFIVTEYQVVEAAVLGADAVLLIVAALDDELMAALMRQASALGLAALVEVHNRVELDRALAAGAAIVGVNSRDLRTLAVDTGVFTTLAGVMPDGVIAVAESGLRGAEDLVRFSDAGYDAFLVGERLIAQPDPGFALRELRGFHRAVRAGHDE